MDIKFKDIEKRFGVPVHTLRNWKRDIGTWRNKLYKHMTGVITKEAYEQLSSKENKY